MSTYAFDLDGTLDKPWITQLCNDLYDAGHTILIVTGGLADSGEWTVPAREQRLQQLGVKYSEIVRVIDPDIQKIGGLKGRICAERKAIVLFDDADMYLVGAYKSGYGRLCKVL